MIDQTLREPPPIDHYAPMPPADPSESLPQDDSGLIFAVRLDGEGSARELSSSEIAEGLPDREMTWVHLDRTNPWARDWLRTKSGIDPIACDALLAEETRPRADQFGTGVLVILRGVNLNPGAEPDEFLVLRTWLDEHKLVTLRMHRVMAIRTLREALQRKGGPESLGELFTRIVDQLVLNMHPSIENHDDLLDAIEEELALGRTDGLRSRLSEARHQTIRFRRYVAPQREAIKRLWSVDGPWCSDRDRAELREAADRTQRFVEELDEARERASAMHEDLLARLAERSNRIMYLLSIVAAIFLPLGFLTGLLGINVGGIPGTESPWAFTIVVLGLLGLVLLEVWLFWKMRWL